MTGSGEPSPGFYIRRRRALRAKTVRCCPARAAQLTFGRRLAHHFPALTAAVSPPQFAAAFAIGRRRVGAQEPVFVIAEAGVAHFGDMALGRQLVELAAASQADAFKLQVFDVEQMIARRATEWRDRLRSRTLTFDQVHELRELCRERNLEFILTAHDESKIEWLVRLEVAAVKVGSGERNNPAFLRQLASLGRPVILSTGMYAEADVREALAALQAGGCHEAALLHCNTSYPTPAADVNLAAMDRLRELFPGPVGYSDHTADDLAVMCAVARGARVIEKHITILRDVPNAQDWKVSAGPEDFPEFVRRVRRVEQLVGHGRKEVSASEQGAQVWALKSLVAARPLVAGTVLSAADFAAKRPGDGILPNRLDEVTGRRLRRALEPDEPVRWEDLT